MSELESKKLNIIGQLRTLCAHCANGASQDHRCPVRDIAARIESLRGVPLIVNNEFRGALLTYCA